MRRRNVLKATVVGIAALAAPRIGRADPAKTITFAPHADLVSVDPVWTTADITRNFSLAVYDTLFGYDVGFGVQPQMAAGTTTEDNGKQWEIILRDGLSFHDGTPVLARDCVATITRFAKRDPFGAALMARTDELSALSDNIIRFRLKQPFALLPNALAQMTCAIMPERLARTDAAKQITEVMGSGPFRYLASERIPGQRVVYVKNDKYVPRKDGPSSFNAGPKIVYVDRVVWNFIPDASTASAALIQGEIDCWENPAIDLVPLLRQSKGVTVAVKDITGEIGCLRFNHLYPPFDNAAVCRVVLDAIDQQEVMEAVAGADPSLITSNVGIFVPGTPMASQVDIQRPRGPEEYERLKRQLSDVGYKDEKVVVLAASTVPAIWAEAQVASDMLKRIGMNIELQSLDWGTVVQRRASKESTDKGGWNIFYTFLGGIGNVSPPSAIALQSNGTEGSWFGWPIDREMEKLREAWLDAAGVGEQKRIAAEMQAEFLKNPPYVPLGMYRQPSAFRDYLTDVRDGWPQFYGVKKLI